MPKRKHATEPDHLNDGMVVLHRSTFIEWRPTPIVALASSQDGSLIVASRENGDVELYENSTLNSLHHIYGHKDSTPTSVVVLDHGGDAPCRIFVAGLDGLISEIDLDNSCYGTAVDSYGGAVWQLAIEPRKHHSKSAPEAAKEATEKEEEDNDEVDNNQQEVGPRLAVACDDGCIRLFEIQKGVPGATYIRSLPRVEGRVLSVAWHPSASALVTGGSDGCIHVWDASSGREILRITAGDSSGTTDLCIWSLIVLNDGTIVAGDSGGNVSFYEGQFGTLLARFTQHDADILQVVASPDGNTVFAAGVDPRIAVFQRINDPTRPQKWTFLSFKRPHTHDVRAMTVSSPLSSSNSISTSSVKDAVLFTGSADTMLIAHSVPRFLKEHPKKVNTCPQRPIIRAAPAVATLNHSSDSTRSVESWLMAASRNEVDIWRLGRPPPLKSNLRYNIDHAIEEGKPLPPQSLPIHLAKIVNRSGDSIVSAVLSPDGHYVAYSDAKRIKCFTLTLPVPSEGLSNEELALLIPRLEIEAVKVPVDLPPATHLFFSSSTHLIAISADGTVRTLNLEDGIAVQSVNRELHDLRYKMWYKRDKSRSAARRSAPAIELATLSPNGKFLAASIRGRIHLLPLESHKIVAAIPPLAADHSHLTAMGFTPDGSALVLATSANHVVAYQMPTGAPSEWSKKNPPDALPKRVLTLPGPVIGVTSSPHGSQSVLLYSSQAVCHVDLAAPVPAERSGKKKRRQQEDAKVATPAGENCRALYFQNPVLYVEALKDAEVVMVERSWADVQRLLPAPLYRHRYGT